MKTMTMPIPHNCASALPDLESVRAALNDVMRPVIGFADGVADVQIERLWPRKSDGVVVEWSLGMRGGVRRRLVGVVGDAPFEPASSQECATPSVTDAGFVGVFATLPDLHVTVFSPDRDPWLPQLGCCLDADAVSDVVVPALSRDDRRSVWPAAPRGCDLLSYRAGRRATLRFTGRSPSGGALVGKTFRDDRGEQLVDLHERVGAALADLSHGKVRVPTPIAYVRELNLALFSCTQGRGIQQREPLNADTLSAMTGALAALQGLEGIDLPAFTRDDECAVLRRWVEFVDRVDPIAAPDCRSVFEVVRSFGESCVAGRGCVVHRDFYENQVLLAEECVTILDLDTLAFGSPCVDVGNFLAHVYLRELEISAPATSSTSMIVAAYEALAPPLPRQELRFYYAAALLRLGMVHGVRAATGRFSGRLIQRAKQVIDQPPSYTLTDEHLFGGPPS